jgi:hypothetical protein
MVVILSYVRLSTIKGKDLQSGCPAAPARSRAPFPGHTQVQVNNPRSQLYLPFTLSPAVDRPERRFQRSALGYLNCGVEEVERPARNCCTLRQAA